MHSIIVEVGVQAMWHVYISLQSIVHTNCWQKRDHRFLLPGRTNVNTAVPKKAAWVSLAGAAQVSFLSRQKKNCGDKTRLLSRQKYACRDKIMFVAINICREKTFVATNIYRNKHNFVATSILLSRQKLCFVFVAKKSRDKHIICQEKHIFVALNICLLRQNFWRDKNDTCGTSCQ